jgi:hypothetical protein
MQSKHRSLSSVEQQLDRATVGLACSVVRVLVDQAVSSPAYRPGICREATWLEILRGWGHEPHKSSHCGPRCGCP